MNSQDFQNKVTAAFLAVFPNGYVRMSPLPLGGDLGMSFYMTREQKDCPHNIRDNDIMKMIFAVHGMKFAGTEEITEKLEMEPYYTSITTIPESQYYAQGREKIKTRKTTNTPEKLLETLTRYFKAAGKQVQDLAADNKLINQTKIKPEYLEINL